MTNRGLAVAALALQMSVALQRATQLIGFQRHHPGLTSANDVVHVLLGVERVAAGLPLFFQGLCEAAETRSSRAGCSPGAIDALRTQLRDFRTRTDEASRVLVNGIEWFTAAIEPLRLSVPQKPGPGAVAAQEASSRFLALGALLGHSAEVPVEEFSVAHLRYVHGKTNAVGTTVSGWPHHVLVYLRQQQAAGRLTGTYDMGAAWASLVGLEDLTTEIARTWHETRVHAQQLQLHLDAIDPDRDGIVAVRARLEGPSGANLVE